MPLDQLWTLCGPWYANRLDYQWKPRTVTDVERLLTDAGLTSDFWRVRS